MFILISTTLSYDYQKSILFMESPKKLTFRKRHINHFEPPERRIGIRQKVKRHMTSAWRQIPQFVDWVALLIEEKRRWGTSAVVHGEVVDACAAYHLFHVESLLFKYLLYSYTNNEKDKSIDHYDIVWWSWSGAEVLPPSCTERQSTQGPLTVSSTSNRYYWRRIYKLLWCI